jgi:Bacterial Ig-like domain (group 1)/Beta-propeller repeat
MEKSLSLPRITVSRWVLAVLVLVAVLPSAHVQGVHAPGWIGRTPLEDNKMARTASITGKAEKKAFDTYGKLPLAFVPNEGQMDARVGLSAQAGGASFYFTHREAVFAFSKGSSRQKNGAMLRLAFLGANPETRPEGRGLLAGKVNYLIGSDPDEWHTNLPTYRQVVYHDLWPGIDMVFRGDATRLKYEFVLRPGAKVEDIRLAYRGAERLSVGTGGQLLIGTAAGTLTDARPVSYQEVRGRRAPVASRFLLHSDARQGTAYGFAVGDHDARQPLVIDPGIVYSTFLGGGSTDLGNPIAVDGAGNAYVTGLTTSTNFPTTLGAFDTSHNGGDDAFVTKLNSTGTALVYSTYLGGSSSDEGFGIRVDTLGSAYLTGRTASTNFPTTLGAFDTSHNGGDDAFVAKLDATGSLLLNSTFLGGSGPDRGRSLAVDGSGSAYVTGETDSSNFPTTAGAFDTTRNGVDAFVTKLNATGSGLAYSTYLGGSGPDRGFGIAVDGSGSAYVTGETDSTNFPTTSGAFRTSRVGGLDAFVTKLNATGTGLAYSTYLGGSAADRGFGIALDGSGSAYVTGETDSSNFPTTPDAFDTRKDGIDAFVTKLNATGSALAYSTFLGGSNADRSFGIAVDGSENAYVTGRTDSPNFPTTAGAFDTSFNNNGDAFVTKFSTAEAAAPATLTLDPAADTNPVGTSHTVTATVTDAGGNPVPGITVRFSVTGAVNTSGQCTTDAAGQCDFTYQGPTSPGVDAITAFADTNDNGTQDVGEPVGAAEKTWTPAEPATLVLEPAVDTNPVGTEHTVTATVRDAFANPTPGITVRLTVTGAVSTSGECTTDAAGQCDFSYDGPTSPGVDAITAFADTNDDGTQDVGEPVGAAEKTWTPGEPATLVLEPPADENRVGEEHCVTATVRDAFGNPTPGITVRFSVSGAHTESGSDTTDADGTATFCYSGTTVGLDAITAFADTNDDGTQDVREPFGAAEKTWTPGEPATLVLEPAADANTVGEEHCVTATVRDAFGNPTPGIMVRFSVPTSVATFASPSSGSDVTDANGEATFCYSASLPGEDAIHAFADTNEDGTQDAGEPFGDATKTWTPPASTELCEVKITEGGWIIANNGDRASFGGNAKVSADGTSVQGEQEYQDHGPAQPRNVHSIELLATTCSEDLTTAAIFGTATIDGSGMFVFRIDVMDLGEPGTNDSYGIMLSDGYFSGQKQLQGGNVKIHK